MKDLIPVTPRRCRVVDTLHFFYVLLTDHARRTSKLMNIVNKNPSLRSKDAPYDAGRYPTMNPPSISFLQLRRPTPNDARELVEIVARFGMVMIREIPGFAAEKHRVLRQIVVCDGTERVGASYRSVELADGTTRSTFAARTVAGASESFSSGYGCHLEGASSHFRATITELVDDLTRLLDMGITAKRVQKLENASAAMYTEFRRVASEGVHLEHFHLYTPRNDSVMSTARSTLPMHTDAGVLLAMTGAEYYDKYTSHLVDSTELEGNGGFVFPLADGVLVAPRIASDSLFVILGEAARHWINPPIDLHVPEHAMIMPSRVLRRAWYGRMIFPPENARLARGMETVTWGEYSAGVHESFRSSQASKLSALGCATRRKLEDSGSCSGESIFCWHSCVPVDNLECGTNA
eukprot:gene15584-18475_t